MARTQAFKHRNLPLLLLKAREAVMQHRRPTLRAHGLSDQQWRVLRVLADPAHAEGLDTGRLARESHLLGPSLTGMLARMERDGLVLRLKPVNDQRKLYVSLTKEGNALYEHAQAQVEEAYQQIEAEYTPEKMKQLTTLLEEFIELGNRHNAAREEE